MATVKVKLRPSSVKDKAGTIYYRIIHTRNATHHYYPSCLSGRVGCRKWNVIAYRRQKNNQQFYIKWEQPMQRLLINMTWQTVPICYRLSGIWNETNRDSTRLRIWSITN